VFFFTGVFGCIVEKKGFISWISDCVWWIPVSNLAFFTLRLIFLMMNLFCFSRWSCQRRTDGLGDDYFPWVTVSLHKGRIFWVQG
jgi:hypothetical protein